MLIPNNWTFKEIPILIDFELLLASSLNQTEFNLVYPRGEIEEPTSRSIINNDLKLLTPWDYYMFFFNSELHLTKFFNLTLPNEKGSGYFSISGTVKTSYSFLNSSLNFSKYSNISEKKFVSWDLTKKAKTLSSIEWVYFDSGPWGQYPGWRLSMNESQTQFKYMDHRNDRISDNELYIDNTQISTPQSLWTKMKDFSINKSVSNWSSFQYYTRDHHCDGADFTNLVKFVFSDYSSITLTNHYDSSGCFITYKTWVPPDFQALKELSWNTLINVKNSNVSSVKIEPISNTSLLSTSGITKVNTTANWTFINFILPIALIMIVRKTNNLLKK